MRIQVSDKSSAEDLEAYLEAGECAVRKVAEVSLNGEVTFDVSIPSAPSDPQAMREIAIYVKAWPAAKSRLVNRRARRLASRLVWAARRPGRALALRDEGY